MSTDSDCLRTTLTDIDFNITSGCGSKILEDNNNPQFNSIDVCSHTTPLEKPIVSDCQVVLEDIFSDDQTGKLKVLMSSQDKTHSATSHQSKDKYHLESIIKKDPIAWPSMKDSDLWSQLDDTVSSCLFGGSSIYRRVDLLETSIYSKAALIFGHLPPPKKGLQGLNRRAKYSIK